MLENSKRNKKRKREREQSNIACKKTIIYILRKTDTYTQLNVYFFVRFTMPAVCYDVPHFLVSRETLAPGDSYQVPQTTYPSRILRETCTVSTPQAVTITACSSREPFPIMFHCKKMTCESNYYKKRFTKHTAYTKHVTSTIWLI